MGFARKCKRRHERNNRQGRSTCPKCHAKLIEKPGYGLACQECGWTKLSCMYREDILAYYDAVMKLEAIGGKNDG